MLYYEESLDRLPEDIKKIMLEEGPWYEQWAIKEMDKLDIVAREKLEMSGVEVIELTQKKIGSGKRWL